MKKMILTLLVTALMCTSLSLQADRIESSTGVMLTFRPCVAGETACDSFERSRVTIVEGLPGDQKTSAEHEEAGFGQAKSNVSLSELPGISVHQGKTTSQAGTRNGSNTPIIRKYTNTSGATETLTLTGELSFKQEVPEENAQFEEGHPARTSANAELGMIRLNIETMEAGTSKQDNMNVLMEGPTEEVEYVDLGMSRSEPSSNLSEERTTTFAMEPVTVEPGESVWIWAILQALAANGASVEATLTTRLEYSTGLEVLQAD